MRRREFIALLVAVAARWSVAAHAQQAEGMRRIGVLIPGTADDAEYQDRMAAFLQELQQLGWSDGRNVRIDTRWAAGDANLFRKYASSTSLGPLLETTRTVPIVFATILDPVGAGFVESLARPGGNATGFISFEYGLSGKWLGAPQEDAPNPAGGGVPPQPSRTRGDGAVAPNQARGPAARVWVAPD